MRRQGFPLRRSHRKGCIKYLRVWRLESLPQEFEGVGLRSRATGAAWPDSLGRQHRSRGSAALPGNTPETPSTPHENNRTPDRCLGHEDFSRWLRFKARSSKTARCRVVLRERTRARATSVRLLTGAARPRIRFCPTRFRFNGTAHGVWIGLCGSGRHDWLLFRWIGRGPLAPRNNRAGPSVPVPRDLAGRCFHGRTWSFFSRAHTPRRNNRLDPTRAFRGRRSQTFYRN